MKKLFLMILTSVILQGCSTYSTHRYSMSMDNVEYIRSAVSTASGNRVAVASFSAVKPGLTAIMCRGVGPIKTPDGETFENYIRKALIDELRLANAYSENGNVIITGTLEHIDFSSAKENVGNGEWEFKLSISSNKGKSFTVSENYNFPSSWSGETACNQTAQAFMPAVQNLIKKVVGNLEFKNMLLK